MDLLIPWAGFAGQGEDLPNTIHRNINVYLMYMGEKEEGRRWSLGVGHLGALFWSTGMGREQHSKTQRERSSHADTSTWKSRVLTQRTQNAFGKCCNTNKQAPGKAEQAALGLNSAPPCIQSQPAAVTTDSLRNSRFPVHLPGITDRTLHIPNLSHSLYATFFQKLREQKSPFKK